MPLIMLPDTALSTGSIDGYAEIMLGRAGQIDSQRMAHRIKHLYIFACEGDIFERHMYSIVLVTCIVCWVGRDGGN